MKGFSVVCIMNRMSMFDSDENQVAIIDYGMGNLFNVERACARVGLRSVITGDKDVIMQSRGIILPGVGAFGDAIGNLKRLDLIGFIRDQIDQRKPFLGICLGMQLLLTESEEFGGHKGLDFVRGRVVKFDNKDQKNQTIKVPQVGWNRIFFKRTKSANQGDFILRTISNGEYMYFVHSYYAVPDDDTVSVTTTCYEGIKYCSSLLKGSVFAVQFHPEKSGLEGLKIYRNWADRVNEYEELKKK